MYDINYFSILKKQKQKNKTFRFIAISLMILILAVNGILFGIEYIIFNKLVTHINTNKEYINYPTTIAKVRDANILNKEVSIAKEYLATIKKTAIKIEQIDLIKVELIDYIRGLAPLTTYFDSEEFKGNTINLKCHATDIRDPMNYYHRLLQDDRFISVIMPGFNVQLDGTVTFEIRLTLKGGNIS